MAGEDALTHVQSQKKVRGICAGMRFCAVSLTEYDSVPLRHEIYRSDSIPSRTVELTILSELQSAMTTQDVLNLDYDNSNQAFSPASCLESPTIDSVQSPSGTSISP